MNVELVDLKWALVASQHRSLRRAAETLNVRQSTLSRRLRDLEHRIGVSLFERTNGGTRPTAAGMEFLVAARHILSETDLAISRLKTRSRGENGRLTIGVYASFSTGNMYATLSEHHRQFPDVEVQLVDGNHDQLLSGLTTKAVDVALMTACLSAWDDRTLPLWSERVVVALHEGHPLARRKAIHWCDLATQTILIPHGGPGPELERLLIAKLGERGPRRVHQESGLDRLLSMVSVEHGLLLMLEGGTGVQCRGVTYHEVHEGDRPTRLDFIACWRRENENPTLAPFLELLRRRYPDLSAAAYD
jgi:DNA-binding transcriptional LysR family regulator